MVPVDGGENEKFGEGKFSIGGTGDFHRFFHGRRFGGSIDRVAAKPITDTGFVFRPLSARCVFLMAGSLSRANKREAFNFQFRARGADRLGRETMRNGRRKT